MQVSEVSEEHVYENPTDIMDTSAESNTAIAYSKKKETVLHKNLHQSGVPKKTGNVYFVNHKQSKALPSYDDHIPCNISSSVPQNQGLPCPPPVYEENMNHIKQSSTHLAYEDHIPVKKSSDIPLTQGFTANGSQPPSVYADHIPKRASRFQKYPTVYEEH